MDADEERSLAETMLARYHAGESKSGLEIEYWADATSHGKHFSSFVKRVLAVETEGRSRQTEVLERLSLLLRRHGIAPSSAGDLSVEDRLIVNARQAALGAIRLYNDPSAGFRTETFIVLMVIAWNCLLQARLEHEGIEYREVMTLATPSRSMGVRGTWGHGNSSGSRFRVTPPPRSAGTLTSSSNSGT